MHALTAADSARLDALEAKGFRVDRPGDMFGNIWGRGGGHYIDLGGCKNIEDGLVKVKSGVPVKTFTKTGLEFEDGEHIEADVIVFATGFARDFRGQIADIVGKETAEKLDNYWGLDAEGELRGASKPSGRKSGSIGRGIVTFKTSRLTCACRTEPVDPKRRPATSSLGLALRRAADPGGYARPPVETVHEVLASAIQVVPSEFAVNVSRSRRDFEEFYIILCIPVFEALTFHSINSLVFDEALSKSATKNTLMKLARCSPNRKVSHYSYSNPHNPSRFKIGSKSTQL